MAGEKNPSADFNGEQKPVGVERTTAKPGILQELALMTLTGRYNSAGQPYMSHTFAVEQMFGKLPAHTEDKE